MSDITLKLCRKIENSYRKGKDCHVLSTVEAGYMERNSRDVIMFLADFDDIRCRYHSDSGKVVFIK